MEVLDKRAISVACIISEKGGHSISACEKVPKCCMKGLPQRTRSLSCMLPSMLFREEDKKKSMHELCRCIHMA